MWTPLSIQDQNDRLSVKFPSYAVPGKPYRIHTYGEGGAWSVWLNTEAGDFDGLIIGQGQTRAEAEAAAVSSLQAIMLAIVEPVEEIDDGA